MRSKSIQLSALLLVGFTLASGTAAFAQTPVVQNRVAQQVMIGGVRVDAAYVLAAGGGIQSYTCPTPQQYATPDGASQGWACFDAATGVWLLSALPPQQQVPAPAPVVQQVIQPPVYQPVYQTVYQPVYQPPVIYEVARPTIIYREPARVIYSSPAYYPRGYYSNSTIIGAATINAAGRIAAAVIGTSRYNDDHRNVRVIQNNGHRR